MKTYASFIRLLMTFTIMAMFSLWGRAADEPKFRTPDFAYPQNVIKDARAMLAKAGNSPDAGVVRLRAMLELSAAEQAIDYDTVYTLPAQVAEQAALCRGDKAAEAMLVLYEADLFRNIYSRQAYKYNRVDAPLEPFPADVSAWSGDQFRARITELLARARSLADGTPLSRFASSLEYSPEVAQYMPTVADFARYFSVEVLNDLTYNTVNYKKEISDICREALVASVPQSAPWFYWQVREIDCGPGSPARKNEAKTALYEKYSGVEPARYVLVQISRGINDSYYYEEPVDEGTLKRDNARRDRIIGWLRTSLKNFPSWYDNAVLTNALNGLTTPRADISCPSMTAPGQQFKVKVSSSFAKNIVLTLHSLPSSLQRPDAASIARTMPVVMKREIAAAQTDCEDSVAFSVTNPGNYALVTSLDGKYGNGSVIEIMVTPLIGMSAEAGPDVAAIAVDFTTGKPLRDVRVTSSQARGTSKYVGKTDRDGLVKFNAPVDDQNYRRRWLSFSYGGRVYDFDRAVGLNSFRAEKENGQTQILVFTDRSIYHPGDSVRWALAMAAGTADSARLMAGRNVEVRFFDANYKPVDTISVTTDAFGRAHGAFATRKGVLTGTYRIQATLEGSDRYILGNANVMVSDFKAPEIQIESTSVQRDIPKAGDVTLSGVVKTYSGMPVAGAVVSVKISGANRWRWFIPSVEIGTLDATTDDAGNFYVVVPESMLSTKVNEAVYHDFIASIDVASRTAETAHFCTNFTNGKPYVIQVEVPAAVNCDKNFEFLPQVFDANGKNVPVALSWWFAPAEGASSTELPEGKAVAGTPVKLDLKNLPANAYKIIVEAADTTLADKYESAPADFYSVARNSMPASVLPLFVPDAKAPVKGSRATATVGVNSDKLYVYSIVRNGESIYGIKVHELGRGFHNIDIDIPADARRCEIRLVSVLNGNQLAVQILPVVPDPEKAEIVAETFRDRLVPGGMETWRFRLMKGSSVVRDAAMIATMYNQALEALQPSNWPSSFAWFTNRGYLSIDYPNLYNASRFITLDAKYLNVNLLEWPRFMFGNNVYTGRVMYKLMSRAAAPTMNMNAKLESVEMETADYAAVGGAVSEDVAMDTEVESVEEAGTVQTPETEYREAEVLQAFWMPNLVADSEGNIDIEFNVPNSNGTWRFLGFGWNKDAATAIYKGLSVASKPVMVQPNLPRFLRQGDQATVLATVFNNSDKETVVNTTVEIFRISDGAVVDRFTSSDTIAPMGSAVVSSNVAAPTTEASVGYRVRAVAGSFADGEQAVIPVLRSASTVIESDEFYLNPQDSKPFTLTVDAPKDATLTLQYCQNPVWTVVKAMRGIAAGEALTANGVVSHLFSALAAKHIVGNNPDIAAALRQWRDNPSEEAFVSKLEKNENLKKLMLEQTPWVQAANSNSERMAMLASLLDPDAADKAIEKCRGQLSKLQNSDGGFRWGSWSDESSVWTTENVLITLGIARSLNMLGKDYDAMLTRAFTYLQKEAAKPNRPATDNELALVAAYFPSYPQTVEGQRIIRRTVAEIATGWKGAGTVAKAFDTFILNANGRRAEAEKVMASIRQFAVEKPGMGLCFPNVSDMRGYATIIQAYAAMNASRSEIDALRQYVIVQAQALDDIGACNPDYIVASVLLTGTDWTSVPVSQNVTVNGSPLAIGKTESNTGYFSQTLTESGKVTVTVTPNGVTPSYGSVIAIYNRPSATVKARPGRDLSIEKRFLVQRDGKWVETRSFALGEKVRVQLTVKANRNLEYVSIDDERPASFEPVDQLPGYVWDASLGFYRENLDASTRLFVGYLPKGTYHLAFDMTAAASGTFTSGIATLQSQYAPELTAHSGGSVIEVK